MVSQFIVMRFPFVLKFGKRVLLLLRLLVAAKSRGILLRIL